MTGLILLQLLLLQHHDLLMLGLLLMLLLVELDGPPKYQLEKKLLVIQFPLLGL